MRGLCVALALCAAPALASAQDSLIAPSGQQITLYDVVLEEDMAIARFLFLAPGIALDGSEGRTFAELEGDFPWLCDTVIRPVLKETAIEAEEVVIVLADREVPFGTRDPEAVQFFEMFGVTETGCEWRGL